MFSPDVTQAGYSGFSSCQGCRRCECGPASTRPTCHPLTHSCLCRPGAGGRYCERCLPGYWDYSHSGCQSKSSTCQTTTMKHPLNIWPDIQIRLSTRVPTPTVENNLLWAVTVWLDDINMQHTQLQKAISPTSRKPQHMEIHFTNLQLKQMCRTCLWCCSIKCLLFLF